MSFTTHAISMHASLQVAGVWQAIAPNTAAENWTLTIYELDNIPQDRADIKPNLPVMFPVFFEVGAQGQVPNATIGTRDISQEMVFLCLVEDPQRYLNLSDVGSKTVEVRDEYLEEVLNNRDLFDALSYNTEVRTEMGIYAFGEQEYAGFLARHTWQNIVDEG